ncbi:MAG: NAD(P)H-dependent oxidoreductase [Myxococcota bacterium]
MLVLYTHPMPHRSRLNRPMAEAARDVDGVTVHELYEAYPDLFINVRHEQQLLLAHDVIVWQHPLYWYSTPSLLKEWQDVVLTYGWAFGHDGDALRGKLLLQAVTVGGSHRSYQHDGDHGCTLTELLVPVAQTAKLCGMTYSPPFAAYRVHKYGRAQIREHVERYQSLLEALADPNLDLDAWALEGPPTSVRHLLSESQ